MIGMGKAEPLTEVTVVLNAFAASPPIQDTSQVQ
jgi:hypothetical protein